MFSLSNYQQPDIKPEFYLRNFPLNLFNPLTHKSLDIPLQHKGQFGDPTLSAFDGKSLTGQTLIIF